MEGSVTLFFFNDTATTEIYTLSLHDALPILPPSSADQWLCRTRLGSKNLRQLDTSNGCQDHTVLPYASAPFVLRAVARSRETALRTFARPTLPRPPHPAPTFVTMANAPLLGPGWGELLELICP